MSGESGSSPSGESEYTLLRPNLKKLAGEVHITDGSTLEVDEGFEGSVCLSKTPGSLRPCEQNDAELVLGGRVRPQLLQRARAR